jgi:hypothetical protein
MKLSNAALLGAVALSVLLIPAVGYCDVIGTLQGIQSKLVNQILPLCAVLGLVFAAFSFFTGNPGARSHLWLAIIGMVIGFGAESIMRLVQSLVH